MERLQGHDTALSTCSPLDTKTKMTKDALGTFCRHAALNAEHEQEHEQEGKLEEVRVGSRWECKAGERNERVTRKSQTREDVTEG